MFLSVRALNSFRWREVKHWFKHASKKKAPSQEYSLPFNLPYEHICCPGWQIWTCPPARQKSKFTRKKEITGISLGKQSLTHNGIFFMDISVPNSKMCTWCNFRNVQSVFYRENYSPWTLFCGLIKRKDEEQQKLLKSQTSNVIFFF